VHGLVLRRVSGPPGLLQGPTGALQVQQVVEARLQPGRGHLCELVPGVVRWSSGGGRWRLPSCDG
jgi:hypothetical protein